MCFSNIARYLRRSYGLDRIGIWRGLQENIRKVRLMIETTAMPAPEIYSVAFSNTKWDREYREFLRLLPSLLLTHRGKFVAIHDGRVVETGDDHARVALDAYARWGYVPMYVGLVTDAPQPVVRIASPRLQ